MENMKTFGKWNWLTYKLYKIIAFGLLDHKECIYISLIVYVPPKPKSSGAAVRNT